MTTVVGPDEPYSPPKINLRLEVADLNGHPVQQLPAGSEYQLRAFAQDIRAYPRGVFSAYMDVTYDSSLTSPLAADRDDVTFGRYFENGRSADFGTPGLVDEVGGFGSLAYPPPGESLVFSVPFLAEQAGTVTFEIDPPEDITHEELVFGEDFTIPWERLLTQSTALTIVTPGDVSVAPDAILENTDTSAGNVEVGVLTAADPIRAATVVYALVSGPGDTDNGRFTIDGDKLLVRQDTVLDADATGQYSVRVRADDGVNAVQESVLTVSVTDVNDGAAGVTLSPISGDTSETGRSATFTIVLDSPPAADVTIALPSSDPTEGTVTPTHVTFTPANWSLPQPVTVHGVDDSVSDGPVDFRVVTSWATSADPDYAGLNAADVDVTNLESKPRLQTDKLEAVSNTAWTLVTLDETYAEMVVVASANYVAGAPPLTTRIRNARDDSFEVRVQRADGLAGSISATVYYTVVEQGVYTREEHGVDMEAFTFTSTVTDSSLAGVWSGQQRNYAHDYTNPVVLGQVMTTNEDPGDPGTFPFSVFWARGATVTDPPSASELKVGKHIGQDAYGPRPDEKLGYIVIEAGSASVDGHDFVAGVGADIVQGPDNGNPAEYALSGFTSATTAVVSAAAMDGSDGGWPVLAGSTPVDANRLRLFFEEDQFTDQERGHTTEQAAYLVFGEFLPAPSQPHLRTGTLPDVSTTGWTTVTLDRQYTSMVVVTSVAYAAGDVPLIPRVRNATGSSFEVTVQRADNLSGDASASIHYTVVEEGVYNEADHGVTMEAMKITSTVTDASLTFSWVGQQAAYVNSYDNPVVLGQVMTTSEDPLNPGEFPPSVFWARGPVRTDPPSSSALYVGKHVGQDPSWDRSDETLGYIVIESGSGSMEGQDYVAGVGADVVQGPDDGPPAVYGVPGLSSATTAVISAAAMDGGDGGWPVLAGPDPVDATSLRLFFEEDKFTDDERFHTHEQVAYLVFGEAAAEPTEPHLQTGSVTDVSNTGWTTVNLDHTYTYDSMVVVASVSYAVGAPPLVTRIQNAAGSSFQVMVQRADGQTGPVAATVYYTVLEEGIYNQAEHGVTMEAVKIDSTVTDSALAGSWLGQEVAYANQYSQPVVLGQVMTTTEDPSNPTTFPFSVFWARGSTVTEPPSADALRVGKHVGQDTNQTRADETIGYIVIETGSGEIEGQRYAAAVGADVLVGPGDPASPSTYPLNGFATVTSGVVSAAAMDGGDGGWPVLAGDSAVSPAGLSLFFEEDQMFDQERFHTTEQAAYLVFGEGVKTVGQPHLKTGSVTGVSNTAWTPVNLDHTYDNMVVVASVNYAAGQPPLVTRIQNASGSSFEVRVQRGDNSTAPITATVHYTVVEQGVYNEADHGVWMEAATFTSTVTDGSLGGSWVGEERAYANSYQSPVVVGQVMTTSEDPGNPGTYPFSAFWARGTSAFEPPSPAALWVGKHAGQASSSSQPDETIGYIVIESGSGTIDGLSYAAGLGGDIVLGPDNGNPANYPLMGPADAATAVVSAAAMDGADGGWPVLAGNTPVTATQLQVFFEEDQFFDDERAHTTEQVAYIVFGAPAALLRGTVVRAPDQSANTPAVSDAQLEELVSQALASWESAEDISLLPAVQVAVGNLPGDQLGMTAGNSITIDVDGAGSGWFIDSTPSRNEEYRPAGSGEPLVAAPGSPAADRYDLLSVLAHELGHVFGLEHDADHDQVMSRLLQPGERRLPGVEDILELDDQLLVELALGVVGP